MKPKTSLVIVLVKFIYFVKSTSAEEVTPKLELGNKCAALPAVSDSSFETLIRKKCNIDKTEYLYKMVQENETQIFWFLARPRRFGKTLLIDVLEAFFSGLKKLFNDTAIYLQHVKSFLGIKYTSGWPEYLVIRLDFSSGISTYSFEKFEQGMLNKFRHIAQSHDIHLNAACVPSALEELITSLHTKYNKKVVVLVDEYDWPYTRAFGKNKELARQILDTLQSFFSTLKGQAKKIRFSFTTGVTRLALSDFFSGANAAVDLSMEPDFAGIVGFNQTELLQYFGAYIENVANKKGTTTKNVLSEMKTWHDGFRFTVRKESLYSPISVIGYLRSEGAKHKAFTATVDDSKFFVEKFKQFPKQALEIFLNDGIDNRSDVLNERKITAKEIELTGKINFENSTRTVALTVLLFHNGYLRIKSFNSETESYILEFSNQEVKENYAVMLYYSFFDTSQNPTELETQLNSLLQELDAAHWKSFISKLNSLHSRIPCFLLTNAKRVPEALFQVSMYWIFHFAKYSGLGIPTMEDATNFGRSDILLSLKNTIHIFELKTLQNAENPLYKCKVKYPQRHFFGTKEVVCVGLKFSPKGVVERESWGVVKFSKEGKIIEESGSISLTNQLNSKEKQKIKNILAIFKKKHASFILQPDKLIEFLTDIGPTTDDEKSFANHFTTDIKTLCTSLKEIKQELQPNLKSMIQGFLNRNDPKENKKPKNRKSRKN